jgi:hypothetical protein
MQAGVSHTDMLAHVCLYTWPAPHGHGKVADVSRLPQRTELVLTQPPDPHHTDIPMPSMLLPSLPVCTQLLGLPLAPGPRLGAAPDVYHPSSAPPCELPSILPFPWQPYRHTGRQAHLLAARAQLIRLGARLRVDPHQSRRVISGVGEVVSLVRESRTQADTPACLSSCAGSCATYSGIPVPVSNTLAASARASFSACFSSAVPLLRTSSVCTSLLCTRAIVHRRAGVCDSMCMALQV